MINRLSLKKRKFKDTGLEEEKDEGFKREINLSFPYVDLTQGISEVFFICLRFSKCRKSRRTNST